MLLLYHVLFNSSSKVDDYLIRCIFNVYLNEFNILIKNKIIKLKSVK